jgi:hypothetical protein
VRSRLLPLAVVLSLAGCGDDGKVGSTSPPTAAVPPARPDPSGPPAPTPPPRDPAVPEPAAPPTSAGVPPSWAGTRAGDWATWRVVSTEGEASVTRVTWRATKVEAGRVSFTVESTTKDLRGTVLSATRTDEVHDLATATPPPVVVRGEARGEDVRVGAVAVPTTARVIATAQGDVQTWTSASVPFTGLVRSVGGGVDQSLEAFGRGR